MTLYSQHKVIFRIFTGVIIFVSAISPLSVSATVGYDKAFFSQNDINIYNPTDVGCDSTGSSTDSAASTINNTDYSGAQILNSAELAAVTQNQPFYTSSAQKYGIPWQVIAAIHYRETGFKNYGPTNGNGPYQIVGTQQPVGQYTDDQFQTATDTAAQFIKNKIGTDFNINDQDSIKKAFFAYNGEGTVYIKQAKAIGFTDAQAANGEGSPYVMNREDATRDPTVSPTNTNNTWGQIKTDGGSLSYPANSGYGAYVIYAALSGISSGGSCSSNTLSSGGMTLAQATAFMDTYKQIDQGDPNGDFKYVKPAEVCHTHTDNCVAFSAYFVQKYTTLKSSFTNGGAFVSDMASKNKGVPTGTIPQVYSIFSTKDGVTMCGAAKCGHTAVILGIDKANNQVIVGEAAWCKPGYTSAHAYSLSKFSNGSYTYIYTGSYLNPDHKGDLK